MDGYRMLIGGELVEAASGRTFEVVDPSRVVPVARVPQADREDVDRAVAAARRAFDEGPWPGMAAEERVRLLLALADRLEARQDRLMELESRQAGIPIRKTTLMDIPVGLEMFRTMVRASLRVARYEPLPWIDFPAVSWNFVLREPVGVCAGICAWNFPWLFTMWKSAPSLAMGNTLVLKPASYTPLTALEFAQACVEAGLPPGVVNVVTGAGNPVGTALCEHPAVDKVSFTGSTEVGREIQQRAAGTIKRVTLELGGKSPNVVLADAELELAVDGALFAAFFNAGQACEAGTRLLLHESIHDEFLARLGERIKLVRVGDTAEFETTMGPVITEGQRRKVEEYIRSAHDEGARLVSGGGRPKDVPPGWFVEPTVFAGVTPRMRIFREEIFGPVLAVTKFGTLDEAITLANDTSYGLAAAVWSRDRLGALDVARRIRAGTVWINDYHLINADAPFGGYKQSGRGRELGRYGLEEYTEVKHVHVDQVGPDRDRKFWFDYVMNRE